MSIPVCCESAVSMPADRYADRYTGLLWTCGVCLWVQKPLGKFFVCVETSKHSRTKIQVDRVTGIPTVVGFTPKNPFPEHTGFIEAQRPLKTIMLLPDTLAPSTAVLCKVIGTIRVPFEDKVEEFIVCLFKHISGHDVDELLKDTIAYYRRENIVPMKLPVDDACKRVENDMREYLTILP